MRMRGYEAAHGPPKANPAAAPAPVLAPVLAPAPIVVPVPAAAPSQPPLTSSKASISQASPANVSKASPKHHLSKSRRGLVSLTCAEGSGPSPNPAAREAMRPPKYGGYSKRDQLGSVNDSWGAEESVDDGGVRRLGLFQVEPEPPSPPASPFP